MDTKITDKTKSTMARHRQAMRSGDMDAVMSNFAEDAVFITQEGIVRGRDQIRRFIEYGLDNMPQGYGEAVEVLQEYYEGEVGYLVYSAKPFVNMGTDTWVVRDDKIIAQTYAAYPVLNLVKSYFDKSH